ncbi:hypothetical protein QOT17_011420, partial [Balamuthia mandrillaris]
ALPTLNLFLHARLKLSFLSQLLPDQDPSGPASSRRKLLMEESFPPSFAQCS